MNAFGWKDLLLALACLTAFIAAPHAFLSPVLSVNDSGLTWQNTVNASAIRVMKQQNGSLQYVATLMGNSTGWSPDQSGTYVIQLVTGADAENWPLSNSVHYRIESPLPQLPREPVEQPADDSLIISRAEA